MRKFRGASAKREHAATRHVCEFEEVISGLRKGGLLTDDIRIMLRSTGIHHCSRSARTLHGLFRLNVTMRDSAG